MREQAETGVGAIPALVQAVTRFVDKPESSARLTFLRRICRRTGRSEETEAKKEQGANWRHDFSLGCDSPATGGSSRLAFLQF